MRKWIAAILIFFELMAPLAIADVQSSKANAYTVLSPPAGVSASKVMAYAVLGPALTVNQPNVFIITKSDSLSH